LATIKDVARLAGVSTATVSATLNKTAYVSPEFEDRVLRAVKLLGYAPSGIARSLKMGVTKLIGLIVADITNPFFTEFVQQVEKAAKLDGYSVILCDADQDVGEELNFIRLLREQRVDGLILAPQGRPDDYDPIRTLDIPVVLIDRLVPFWAKDGVLLDNVAAGRLGAEHVLSFGHRRIAMIAGTPHLTSSTERLEGFAQALQEHGVPLDADFIRYGNFREEAAYTECLSLFAGPLRPTAVLVANNLMLIGLVRALAELGLHCPRDVSIVAIDDLPWASAFTPPLTTIRQPIAEIAEAALGILLSRIRRNGPAEPVTKRVAPELIVRRSCRAVEG